MLRIRQEDNRIRLEGEMGMAQARQALDEVVSRMAGLSVPVIEVDLAELERIDSAGVAVLDEIQEWGKKSGIEVTLINPPDQVKEAQKLFSTSAFVSESGPPPEGFFYRVGNGVFDLLGSTKIFLYLIADAAFFSIAGLFNRRGIRKGEFINQTILIGMNAVPIIALISFLIGFILALQSAAQLRQFGAAIYVADLIAISMTREMGPLITAIIFAGRSGSAIASELATMVVTEETDALRSMALHPTRYVLVPKIYAISLTMPLLTILSVVIGIFGAMVIGFVYLGIGFKPFFQEVLTVLFFRDIITGLLKSLVFAWIIVLVGAYYGFSVKGGSEGVGRVTTAAVVASIFWVILADSILGLIFYFGQGLEY
jgi:phospholipid/cholesterol/gamma-HCH transport system permease protein